MSRLDALEALLGEARVLLQDADDLTVSEALERGEAPDAREWEAELTCEFCGHGWHGLSCYTPPCYRPESWHDGPIDTFALTVTEPGRGDCRCDGSAQRKDDTWRPVEPDGWWRSTWVEEMMDRHGVDGWAAQELLRRPSLRYLYEREAQRARQVWTAPLDGPVTWTEIGSCNIFDVTLSFESFEYQVRSAGRVFGRMAESLREVTLSLPPVTQPVSYRSDAEVAIFRARQARSGTGPSRPGPEARKRPRRI